MGDLVGWEQGQVQPDARCRPTLSWHRDVDPRKHHDPPQRGGRPVAQHRPGAAGEDRCHPAPFSRDHVVARGVNSAVKGLESTASQSKVDRIRPDAELEQLPAGEHPVLASREAEHRLVRIRNLTFAAYVPVNVRRVGHEAEFGARHVTGWLWA
jgi:hypothetical protein